MFLAHSSWFWLHWHSIENQVLFAGIYFSHFIFPPMRISAKIRQDARFIFVEDSSGDCFFIKSDRIKPVSGEDLATEWEAHSMSFLRDVWWICAKSSQTMTAHIKKNTWKVPQTKRRHYIQTRRATARHLHRNALQFQELDQVCEV